jgi:hypothetical protein
MRAGLFSEKFSILVEEQFLMGFIFIDTHIIGDDPFGIHFENFINGITLEILRNILQNRLLQISRLKFGFGLGKNDVTENSENK